MTTAVDRYISSLDEGGPVEQEAYTGGIVNLRTIKDALRRRRRTWVSFTLLGLVVGAAMHLVVPAKYQAVTMLYLTEPDSGAYYKVTDDANLLQTDTVADRALALLGIHNVNDLPGTYLGVALGDVLLEIEVEASTPTGAVRWANALAEGFLSVRAKTLGGQTALVVASQEDQEKQLESDLQRLNSAITALSAPAAGSTDANQVSEMLNERSVDETQLTTLQYDVQQDLLEENAVNQGSYVLDPPRAVLVHTKRIIAEDGLSGLVAGLALGVGIVVIGAIISNRPRYRAEVAALLGAPVELSLRRGTEPRFLARVARRRGYKKKPTPELELAQRRLRDRLGRYRGRPALAVVSAGEGSVATAAAVLTGLALALAAEGKKVALVDMAEGRPLARVFKARRKDGGPVRTVSLRGQQLRLAVAPADVMALDREEVTRGADAVLVLADADPAFGAEHLRPWVEDAIVILRAGGVSDVLVEATGQMLREAGVLPISAILIGADKTDETSGAVDSADQEVLLPLGVHGGRHNGWAASASTSTP